MKRIVALILVLIVLLIIPVLYLTGCAAPEEYTDDVSDELRDRFIVVQTSGVSWSDRDYRILVDAETRVVYLEIHDGSAFNAITVLLNADGRPLLWEGALE